MSPEKPQWRTIDALNTDEVISISLLEQFLLSEAGIGVRFTAADRVIVSERIRNPRTVIGKLARQYQKALDQVLKEHRSTDEQSSSAN